MMRKVNPDFTALQLYAVVEDNGTKVIEPPALFTSEADAMQLVEELSKDPWYGGTYQVVETNVFTNYYLDEEYDNA